MSEPPRETLDHEASDGSGSGACATVARQGVGERDEPLDFRTAGRVAAPHPDFALARCVFFVGFMGAGKTSVARRLARRCHVASIDTDTYLERREDASISDLFDAVGEEGFRALETEVLEELAGGEPLLVSCGGGVVTRPENREILARAGFVVHLQVTADEAVGRISNASTRPLLQNIEAARARCAQRMALYESVANVTVDTAGKSVSAIVREVQDVLEREGVLCRQQR